MPIYPNNQRMEIAMIAAEHGWDARERTVGSKEIATVVTFRRQYGEVAQVRYNYLDKMVDASIATMANAAPTLCHRASTLKAALSTPTENGEPDDGPTMVTKRDSVEATRQDPETREWRRTAHACASSNPQGEDRQWWVYKPGVREEIAQIKGLPENEMRRIVLAVLREIG